MPTARPGPVRVHLLPALIPPGSLRGGLAVVIDVLRATTTMVHALAAGARAIIPCVEVEEAREVARRLPAGSAVLGGERRGLPIEGFDLGNSPSACMPTLCSGRTLVMTTTNGTRAIHAALDAARVLVAGFVNRAATMAAAGAAAVPVHLICSGTDGQVSLEDTLLAGALAHGLDALAFDDDRSSPNLHGRDGDLPRDTILANDSAEVAATLWRATEAMFGEGYPLAAALGDGRGGRRVHALGLGADLEDAARIDRFDLVAELFRDPDRIVALPRPGA